MPAPITTRRSKYTGARSITIRVTAEEYAALVAYAHGVGVSVSAVALARTVGDIRVLDTATA